MEMRGRPWGRRVLGPVVAAVVATVLVAGPASATGGRDDPLGEYASTFGAPGVAAVVVHADGRVDMPVTGVDGNGRPITPDTQFKIASLSKSFTAAAVMQLVDAGRVHLDQPIVALIPDLHLADPRAGAITVRHLLSHTSGLTIASFDEYALPAAGTPAEVVTRLDGAVLTTAPGSSYTYYNTNYVLAARIVELVSGRPFDHYQAEELFAPLGMRSTTSVGRCEDEVPGLARGHIGAFSVRLAVREIPGTCAGNGGVVSTPADMARWLRFHLGDGTTAEGRRLLTTASMRELHTPQPGAGDYALGWERRALPSGAVLAHGGTLATSTSDMVITRAGTAALVLVNTGGVPAQLTTTLLAALDGGTAPPPDNPLTVIDTALLALGVLAAALLGTAVVRAPRWARRRQNGRAGFRLLLPILTAVVGIALPLLAASLFEQATLTGYLYVANLIPMIAVLAAVLALGGTTATIARTLALRRVRAARPV